MNLMYITNKILAGENFIKSLILTYLVDNLS